MMMPMALLLLLLVVKLLDFVFVIETFPTGMSPAAPGGADTLPTPGESAASPNELAPAMRLR